MLFCIFCKTTIFCILSPNAYQALNIYIKTKRSMTIAKKLLVMLLTRKSSSYLKRRYRRFSGSQSDSIQTLYLAVGAMYEVMIVSYYLMVISRKSRSFLCIITIIQNQLITHCLALV